MLMTARDQAMVTVDGGGDGDSEDGGNGISNGDNEGSCESRSAQMKLLY